MTGLELAAAWLGIAVLGAVLALDDTALAQTWLSQPLPAALLTGLVLGEPGVALVPGFFMQMLVLGNLPVGTTATLDCTGATVGVVGGVLVAGWTPGTAAGPVLTWFGAAAWPVGLMLLLMVIASQLGGRLVVLERRSHLAWKLMVYRELRDGDLGEIDRLHQRALVVCALRGAAVSLLLAVVISLTWQPLLALMPGWSRQTLALAPSLSVLLALGGMSDRMGHRRAAPWLLASLAVGLALGRFVT